MDTNILKLDEYDSFPKMTEIVIYTQTAASPRAYCDDHIEGDSHIVVINDIKEEIELQKLIEKTREIYHDEFMVHYQQWLKNHPKPEPCELENPLDANWEVEKDNAECGFGEEFIGGIWTDTCRTRPHWLGDSDEFVPVNQITKILKELFGIVNTPSPPATVG